MTTQQKFNIAIVAVVLSLFGLLIWSDANRGKQDAAVLGASIRAEKAIAVFRADSARLAPVIVSITKQIQELQTQQSALQIRILLNTKRNEALNKNLDSINGRLGLRPRF